MQEKSNSNMPASVALQIAHDLLRQIHMPDEFTTQEKIREHAMFIGVLAGDMIFSMRSRLEAETGKYIKSPVCESGPGCGCGKTFPT